MRAKDHDIIMTARNYTHVSRCGVDMFNIAIPRGTICAIIKYGEKDSNEEGYVYVNATSLDRRYYWLPLYIFGTTIRASL